MTATPQKRIALREQRPQVADRIAVAGPLSGVASRVLAARGFDADDALRLYLNPTLKEGLPPPTNLKNLDAACTLIGDVLRAGGKIAICSDFDVDGLSGGAQMAQFLREVGGEVQVFVPDRFTEGYGLNRNIVQGAKSWGASLLISIDFGTKNGQELEFARSIGLLTIVIDHHHVGDTVVPADVFINPHQEGCGFANRVLCASALTWYVIVGLRSKLSVASGVDVRSYLDLACLGTICDMVPLVGVNRILARRGLELLGVTTRPGLRALKEVIGMNGTVGCHDVSFGIGPRLNAAGRMMHGELVIKLLTTADRFEALRLAKKLNQLNGERQEEEQSVRRMALEEVQRRGPVGSAVVVWNAKFHTGVIGIVAQRLAEIFHRPVVVLGMNEEGVYKGSVRGIRGFSVVDALAAVSDTVISYGGHDGAGGLSVTGAGIDHFAERFQEECARRLAGWDPRPVVEADTCVDLAEMTLPIVQDLKRFAPFGVGNSSPVLLAEQLTVTAVQSIKGTHLKATFFDGTRSLQGIFWRQTSHPALTIGGRVNAAFKAEINTFQGVTAVQAVLQAVESVS